MELGGNAPFIVHEDADLDKAVEGAILAKMRNNGEACTAANRFHAHESIAQQFGEKLAARLGAMKVGRGTLEDTKVGPLINESQREIVEGLVEDAVSKGGKILTGGERPDGEGYYYPPTVIGDLSADANILVDEVFGPVAPIKSFSTEEEALASANATEYGLAAYVYTTRPRPRLPHDRGPRDRHGRPQPRRDQQPGRAVRRNQAERIRQGRRFRGDRGVPRDEVRRDGFLTRSP